MFHLNFTERRQIIVVNVVFLLTLNNPSVFHYYEPLPSWKIYPSSSPLPNHNTIRSSPPEVFCKKGFLTNFAKFTGKHLCQSLRPATLLKKSHWHRCFPVNFAKFLRTPFSTEHLQTTASVDRNSRDGGTMYHLSCWKPKSLNLILTSFLLKRKKWLMCCGWNLSQ